MAETATLGFDVDELRNLDQLLMETIPIIDDFVSLSNYPNPATSSSESFINSLEIVKITTPVILTKLLPTTCCAICTDDFGVNDNPTQLPYCRHWFHHECILPWLKRNNTCPLCRHQLFVDKGDDMMDFDISTQNQPLYFNFEGAMDEHILFEMLDEALNERDMRQPMETDFSITIGQYEQLLFGSSVSEEELQHQQTIDDILSELLDESRDNNTRQNQQL